MTALLKAEELLLFVLTVYLFGRLGYDWWVYLVLLLVPDLSMLAYAGGARLGAIIYNIVHLRALAIGLYLAGAWAGAPGVQLAGLVLLGHSTLDRVFGFGLKYSDAFQHTHLGMLRGRGG